jgi:hypothetical protein
VDALVMRGAAGRMLSERALECVPAAFEAEIVMVEGPAAVGIPETFPLVVLIVRPIGRFEAP